MKYCNGTNPYKRTRRADGGYDHYTRHTGTKDHVDIFKFDHFEIQMKFESNPNIPDDIFVLYHLSADDYIDLNISRDSFLSMNFDPKNPQDIIDRLKALKSFY